MSLLFVSRKGSTEVRWITYALLRDAVQHHLEGGRPGPGFEVLHSVTRALGGSSVRLSATGLLGELRQVQALLDRPIAELALSSTTQAAISLQWPLPPEPSTRLVQDPAAEIPLLSGDPRTLRDVFGDFVDSLVQLLDGAAPDEILEVSDG